MKLCPCGSTRDFDQCCGPIIAGEPAPTAEILMRSRYTAFVTGELDHVARTHAPEIQLDFNRAEAERLAEECEWHGLDIRHSTENGDTAEVDFVIRFKRDNQEMAQAEVATFRRENGRWLYVNGEIGPAITQRRVIKVGRNDPCPCGSGKKAKQCCGTAAIQN